jgi:UDP-N-acetylglucosamine 2-epimerase
MQTVLSVIGTRPEAIKMAPVIHELERHPASVRSVVCVTGQHRQMLDQVMELFGIVPDCDLNLMQPNQGLATLTASLFASLDRVLERTAPDWVLAQGDTTTVMVASLAAFYRGIPFGHVEAGLRTGDMRRPFPEEANRRIADIVADLLFAPTARSRQALIDEGSPHERVFVTGNTVVDALMSLLDRPYDWSSGPLAQVPRESRLVLVTGHRRESFGGPMVEICKAIACLASRHREDGVHFVYPVHMNPNVRKPVQEILGSVPNVSLIEPVDYLSLINVMKRSDLVLTDSGGIQEEAPTLGVPVLVMRETTERPEGVEAGLVRLVGTSRERIVSEASAALGTPPEARRGGPNPYGDGMAAKRIVSVLLHGTVRQWAPKAVA